MTYPICRDCKHAFSPNKPEFESDWKCRAPQNTAPHPVTGAPSYRYYTCSVQRDDGWLSAFFYRTCGKRGRWFEKKEDAT